MTAEFLAALARDFSPTAWADDFESKLPLQTDVALMRADWNGAKERLRAADPVRFRNLNVKLAARAKEIGNG
jgi:hypothetical protein